MKRIFQKVSNRIAALTLGGAVVLAGSALAFTQKPKAENFNAPPLDERPISREAGSHASFAPVVKKVAPAVVKVFTTTRIHNTGFNGMPDNNMDDMLRRFFGEQFEGRTPRRNRGTSRQEGIGSGVVVTRDGYILTNNHVVDGADEVKVALQDGREFTAKVIGRDPKSDVAVIKVDAKDLPAVPMADSDKVEVGDVVLAVGNPFGIGQTVTTGIVSATGRGGAIGLDYEDFIQTDAAINPGNSGGALVNTRGELVGINSAIVSGSGGNQGIGFAIPINMARNVMDQLIKNGKVVRGWIGLSIQDLTPELAEGMGLTGREGALISGVQPDTPAKEAGLQRGDVITAVDGAAVKSNAELRNRIAATPPGTRVALTVIRDSAEKKITVTLGELPTPGGRGSGGGGSAPLEEALGISVRALTREIASQLGYEGDTGVVISDVEEGSPAGEAGLQQGDLIKEINRHPVTGVNDYREALLGAKGGKTILLLIRRGDAMTYVSVRP